MQSMRAGITLPCGDAGHAAAHALAMHLFLHRQQAHQVQRGVSKQTGLSTRHSNTCSSKCSSGVLCRQQDLPSAQLWKALSQLCTLVAARCELMDQALLAPAEAASTTQPVELDRKLQGYQPLRQVHSRLDFSGPRPADEVIS